MNETSTSPGAKARRLVRAADRAALASALVDGGWPYASLVLTACGHDAAPLVLISDLAEHTRNLAADSRVSLLFDDTAGLDSPLTGARATVLGRLVRAADPGLMARYVARHPDAAAYAGFADFALYRMEVERAHLVAGFGEIHWIEAAEFSFDTASMAGLAEAEDGIVAHMNGDHADAIQLYASALMGLPEECWTMTGIDPEGADLRRGGAVGRLDFGCIVDAPEAARAELVRLAQQARAEP